MFEKFVNDYLAQVESTSRLSSRSDGFAALRHLGLDDFGYVLWQMPLADYPKLSSVLPPMTPDDITSKWTGNKGLPLLQQGIHFVRACAEGYTSITGTTLHNKRILDFGCVYGRFLRLFSYYSENVFGVDALEESLENSRTAGFGDVIRKSDPVPVKLPFKEPFDFLFAFSIFTHLSKQSTISSLLALRKAARERAILVITIRPIEFWRTTKSSRFVKKPEVIERMISDHKEAEFAFLPYNFETNNASGDYGDTSMSLEWLLDKAKGWKYEAMTRSINNKMQRYIFLSAV